MDDAGGRMPRQIDNILQGFFRPIVYHEQLPTRSQVAFAPSTTSTLARGNLSEDGEHKYDATSTAHGLCSSVLDYLVKVLQRFV